MAVEVDRGPLSGAAEHPRRSGLPWLVFTGIVLVAALLAVVLTEGRQLWRLTELMSSGSDLRLSQIHRQHTEYLQLREQWQRALDESEPLDARMLTLRYEIWVGRIQMLREDTSLRRIVAGTENGLEETLRRIEAFIARADPLVSGSGDKPPSRQALRALQPELMQIGEVMNDLSLAASHRASVELAERHALLGRYTQITIALTVCLSLLVLAFAAIALRQMRQLDQRRRSLEALAEHLREARRDAEAASHAKSIFLANMSHEIRTPFQGLLGMLSMLRESGLSPRQIDYLKTATESADHLLAVLNDILDMSQLEAGRLNLIPGPVDLRAMLQEVEALMRPQASTKHLQLHVSIDAGLPERVLMDATRVKQVLFNLLSNAIKFSDRGEVLLEVRSVHAEGASDQLEFVVTDTGIGMDAATIERLFQRFARGDDAPGSRQGGSGLGLEISRTLARLMGGDIRATSRVGVGSSFTFVMPLQAVQPPAAVESAAAAAERPAPALQVLVAEDHVVNRQVLSAMLESMGHAAHFVSDGDQAVAAVRDRHFDLVLMDVHMPGVDGISATRQIRALPDRAAATIPIVALTADAFTDTRQRCQVAGMNDFLTKPVSREKLAGVLRQLFGRHSASAAGETLEAAPSPAVDGPANLIDSVTVASALQVLPADRFGALMREFLEQAPSTVDRLRAAVRDAQPLELKVHAHAVRGAALNLGLTALASTAESLQNGAAHLPAHEIARLVQRFEDLLAPTRAAAHEAGLL